MSSSYSNSAAIKASYCKTMQKLCKGTKFVHCIKEMGFLAFYGVVTSAQLFFVPLPFDTWGNSTCTHYPVPFTHPELDLFQNPNNNELSKMANCQQRLKCWFILNVTMLWLQTTFVFNSLLRSCVSCTIADREALFTWSVCVNAKVQHCANGYGTHSVSVWTSSLTQC